MLSHRNGNLSAATQVKVLSPEISYIALGQGFHILETRISLFVRGENRADVPGSESVAGRGNVYVGTWESRDIPNRVFRRVEETMRKACISAVGLIHSRGVGWLTPGESRVKETLEGISSMKYSDEVCYAIH